MTDMVNHPGHYTQYPGIEVIDLTKHMNFCRGNAVKYLARAGHKGVDKEIEDLNKAAKYIEFEIERLENEQRSKADPSRAAADADTPEQPILSGWAERG